MNILSMEGSLYKRSRHEETDQRLAAPFMENAEYYVSNFVD